MSEPELSNELVEARPAYSRDADPRDIESAEKARKIFDCNGSLWAQYTSASGTSCHGMPIEGGAPPLGDCTVYVQAGTEGKTGYRVVKPSEGSRFSPYEITEDWLFELGGGRKYQLQLRYGGRTIPHSYLIFDLRSRGPEKPLFEDEERETAPVRQSVQPSATRSTPDVLALGKDPLSAALGSALDDLPPVAKVVIFYSEKRVADTQAFAAASIAQSQSTLQTFARLFGEASRGGGGEVAELLRAQNAETARIAAEAQRAAQESRDRLHAMELERVRAAAQSNASARHPALPIVADAAGRVLSSVGVALVNNAGPEAAARVLGGVASAAGAVANATAATPAAVAA